MFILNIKCYEKAIDMYINYFGIRQICEGLNFGGAKDNLSFYVYDSIYLGTFSVYRIIFMPSEAL